MTQIKSHRKLIEAVLPPNTINAAATRAVLFVHLVNDSGYQHELGVGTNEKEAEIKCEALFQIICDLMKWENTNNGEALNRAREAVWESWREPAI